MQWLATRLAIVRIRKDFGFFLASTIALLLAILSLISLEALADSKSASISSYAVDALPAGERVITGATTGLLTRSEYVKISKFLTNSGSRVTKSPFVPLVLLHQLADNHGTGFYLGSLEKLNKSVRLVSGRFPHLCTAERCEVIEIDESSVTPKVDSLNVVIVGRGILTSKILFSGTYGLEPNVSLLLSEGIGSLNNLRAADTLQGSNGWVTSIDRNALQNFGADYLGEQIVKLANEAALQSPSLSFTWPQDALVESGEDSLLLRAKLHSIGHSILILLIFFLFFLGVRKRGEHQKFRSGLSRIGTPKSILLRETFTEFSAPHVISTLLALVISPFLIKLISVLDIHLSLKSTVIAVPTIVFLLLIITALMPGVQLFSDGSWSKWRFFPFIVAGGIALLFLRFTPDNSFQDWKTPIVAVVCSIGLTSVALLVVSHIERSRSASSFIILKEEFRVWQAIAAVTAFTLFLATFSLAFNSKVEKEVETIARNQVPLDLLIKPGTNLITPLEIANPKQLANVLVGAQVFPILRAGTSIRTIGAVSESLALIGVPFQAISQISPQAATKFTVSEKTSVNAFPAIELSRSDLLKVRLNNIPSEIEVAGWFISPQGEFISANFKGSGNTRTLRLGDAIPLNSALISLELHETSDYVSRRLHAQGEGDFQVPILTGRGGVTELKLDSRVVPLEKYGWDIGNFEYSFNGDHLYLHPRWMDVLPSVITDPATAKLATNGILTLSGSGTSSFKAKIAGIQANFPSAGERFVVMNLASLQLTLAKEDIGTINPIELWVTSPDAGLYEKLFNESRFSVLSIHNRQAISKRLLANPSVTGEQLGLQISILFATVLALIFLISTLPLVTKQRRKLLAYLESLGNSPKTIRRSLAFSFGFSVGIGVIIGTLSGQLSARVLLSNPAPYVEMSLLGFGVILLAQVASRIYLSRIFVDSAKIVE